MTDARIAQGARREVERLVLDAAAQLSTATSAAEAWYAVADGNDKQRALEVIASLRNAAYGVGAAYRRTRRDLKGDER